MAGGKKAPPVQPRPKKLYRQEGKSKDERPAVGVKNAAKVAGSKAAGDEVAREPLKAMAAAAGLRATAAAAGVSLQKLTRKELQARAIKAGLKASLKTSIKAGLKTSFKAGLKAFFNGSMIRI